MSSVLFPLLINELYSTIQITDTCKEGENEYLIDVRLKVLDIPNLPLQE